jgi:hypothetical protein
LIDHFDWHRFLHGDIQRPVTLGRLSKDLVKFLGATDDRVYLHPSYAPKFLMKHGLTANHMQVLPACIENGLVIQDRIETLSFFYRDETVFSQNLHVVLKVTGQRHQIWIVTYFRISKSDQNRRMKRGTIVREQK